MTFLAVAAGSALGGLLRYSLSVAFATKFPWPTLSVNVLGSLLIGALFAATAPEGRYPLSPTLRALLMPGFCGGFTTFSTFSVDTWALWQDSPGRATVYIVLSIALSLAATWSGIALAGRR